MTLPEGEKDMAMKTTRSKELKGMGYEMFIGALSILSIFNLVLSYAFRQDANLQYVVLFMNAIFMPIFLADFFYRLFTTDSKTGYFFRNFGWADLLSSLPLPQAKILRVFRLWRVIRLVRNFGLRNMLRELIENRAANALLTVVFLVFCVLEFGSLAVLSAEQYAPSANITNASSALWWDFVTITTVGYGDRYPVTNAGRLVGVFVMIAGVGLFGTLSGFLANTFLSPARKKEEPPPAPAGPGDPKAKLAEIRRLLADQEKATADLKAKLDEIDNFLQ
jgi:voltage-gated potassium channel Kch